ncbi:uncharacterized protein LOC112343296 [Selaginella moellendorffii]|uniref:uncharacterized protein LOC112343296 n=1 Tax=Selaginella moellendorffii TaxID=88036 RepID=UPI000D1CD391|nr:uncharacterized protein LOC112343296 [Selaginella moellendorffii]|eukprot:XP_024522259.1 uncharacterized protein LOC112343296 [Selaginella moellendorffii]
MELEMLDARAVCATDHIRSLRQRRRDRCEQLPEFAVACQSLEEQLTNIYPSSTLTLAISSSQDILFVLVFPVHQCRKSRSRSLRRKKTPHQQDGSQLPQGAQGLARLKTSEATGHWLLWPDSLTVLDFEVWGSLELRVVVALVLPQARELPDGWRLLQF